jgi:hypothetical protein
MRHPRASTRHDRCSVWVPRVTHLFDQALPRQARQGSSGLDRRLRAAESRYLPRRSQAPRRQRCNGLRQSTLHDVEKSFCAYQARSPLIMVARCGSR